MSKKQLRIYDSIDDVNEGQWNNVVKQADHGTVYHRHGWLDAIETALDAEPMHVVVAKSGNPIAILPNFLREFTVSVDQLDRVADYLDVRYLTSIRPGFGGPVIVTDEETCLRAMFDAIDSHVSGSVLHHEIRTNDESYVRYGKFLEGKRYEPTLLECRFDLPLHQSWDDILENMDKERRKEIRQAHEKDVQVEVQPLDRDLDRTYEFYANNVERVGGDPVPKSFFEVIDDRMSDAVRVFSATVEGEEVGRYVHLLDDQRSTLVHQFSAIPDESCFEYSPSELLHERAIKWGMENGYERYSFGETASDFTDSVFKFKEKFGGRVAAVPQWEKGLSKLPWFLYKKGRSASWNRS